MEWYVTTAMQGTHRQVVMPSAELRNVTSSVERAGEGGGGGEVHTM